MLEGSVLGLKYHRALAGHVSPEFTESLKSDYDYSFVVSYGGFEDPDYKVVDKHDMVIDLTGGIDSAFASFSATTRNEIRKFDRIDALQFHPSYDDFDSLYRFHAACERERGWLPVPEDELRNSLVFCVSFNDMLISGISCYHSRQHMRVGRIFSLRRSDDLHEIPSVAFSSAARRIVFEFCKYALENGFHAFDLAGIAIAEDGKRGIANFKRSFGGEIVPVKIGRFAKSSFETKKQQIREIGLDVT